MLFDNDLKQKILENFENILKFMKNKNISRNVGNKLK